MIRVDDRVKVRLPPDEALRYLADFVNLPAWDPGIARVARDNPGPLAPGARYTVVARFFGQNVPMAYELVALDWAEGRAELRGRADAMLATDRIHVTPDGAGAMVHWEAEFEPRGAQRMLTPLLRPLLRRVAERAMEGLRARHGA